MNARLRVVRHFFVLSRIDDKDHIVYRDGRLCNVGCDHHLERAGGTQSSVNRVMRSGRVETAAESGIELAEHSRVMTSGREQAE